VVDGDTVRLTVVSDRLEPTEGTLRLAQLDFDGAERWSETLEVTVAPGASRRVFGRPLTEVLGDADPQATVLEISLDLATGGTARNLLYFARPKDLRLAADPGLDVRVGWDRGSAVVVVTARQLAKNVALSVAGVDGRFSDNYFDVLPGRPRVVRFTAADPSVAIAPRIRARSLADAW